MIGEVLNMYFTSICGKEAKNCHEDVNFVKIEKLQCCSFVQLGGFSYKIYLYPSRSWNDH